MGSHTYIFLEFRNLIVFNTIRNIVTFFKYIIDSASLHNLISFVLSFLSFSRWDHIHIDFLLHFFIPLQRINIGNQQIFSIDVRGVTHRSNFRLYGVISVAFDTFRNPVRTRGIFTFRPEIVPTGFISNLSFLFLKRILNCSTVRAILLISILIHLCEWLFAFQTRSFRLIYCLAFLKHRVLTRC